MKAKLKPPVLETTLGHFPIDSSSSIPLISTRPRLPPFPKYQCRKRPRVGRRQVFTCSLAEQRSKTELIGSRPCNSYKRATRLRPRMGERGPRESCVRSLPRASHPQPDKFV